ncbi:hypothetical protein IJI94_00110, partial [Candidatus Saccharibacteria bacterium]|nr:hypothetical protein [Candidatus Saccharibacteria bacterium]
SGAFIFAGIILLLALVAKMKKNKQAGFKSSLTRKHYTTRILGFAAFLALIAGIGGTAVRFMGAKAENIDYDGVTTSDIVEAKIVKATDDYRLYCGTDTVTIKNATENGYLLYAKSDNAGDLISQTTSVSDIKSIEDWSILPNNTWGFKTNQETYAEITELGQYKPLNLGEGVIAASYEASPANEQIQVDYCAKLARDAADASYTSSISYGVIALNGDNIIFVNGIDYDSPEDFDGDGLANRKETRYGSNVLIDDTDLDGLSDKEEIDDYGTNPVNEDTDSDTISDYSEIILNLNPKNSKSNGVDLDSDRVLNYTISDQDSGVSIALRGTGDLPMSRVSVNDDLAEVETSAINLYSLATDANVDSAVITIPYDLDTLSDEVGHAVTATELVIAKYDSNEDKLTTVPSTVNTTASTISATMSDLDAQYIIADKDTGNVAETVVEDVLGSATDDETDDMTDILGAPLKSIISKAVSKTQATKKAQATDCLTSTNGCDSGFRAEKNGFSFSNFSAGLDANGVCIGMAIFSKLYHEKKIADASFWFDVRTYGYRYSSPNLTTYYYNLGNLVSSGKTLYEYTKATVSNEDIIDVQHGRYDNLLKPGTYNYISGGEAVVLAVYHGRKFYDETSGSRITFHVLDSLSTKLALNTKNDISTTQQYINIIKRATSEGRSVLASTPIYTLMLIHSGAHAVNIESIKLKSTSKSGTSEYTIKYYDNNHTGKEANKTATMKCTNKKCKVTAVFSSIMEGEITHGTFILGSEWGVADTEDVYNIFSESSEFATRKD